MKTATMSSQLIDEKVTLTMIACCVLSLMVLAFRYKSSEPEFPVSIAVKEGTLYTGKLIKFTATGKDITPRTQLYWDFGDKSNLHDAGIDAMHYYKIPGRYDVSLTINGKRKEIKTIHVTTAPVVVDKRLIAQLTGPRDAVVGQPVTFKNLTPDASKFEWNFGESYKTDATTAEPKYTFRTSGYKTVTLRVNGDMVGTMTVFVKVKPSEKKDLKGNSSGNGPGINVLNGGPTTITLNDQLNTGPAKKDSVKVADTKPKAPSIANDQLEGLFKQVVDGHKKASDFSAYIEPNRNITVYLNNKGMTLHILCQKLREIKSSRKIKDLTITHIEKNENNYITTLNIKLDTKGLLGGKY
jgi:PKD repeat protein